MGCDIYLFIERKTPDGWRMVPGSAPEWWTEDGGNDYRWDGAWDVDRIYPLFAWLAGVRSMERYVVCPPRGLPDDLSAEISAIWDESGEHSPSWLPFSVLRVTDRSNESWAAVLAEMERLAAGDPESVRAVFWFDD